MVAAMLNSSLVLWKTNPVFAQSQNWWLAACFYKHSHGSFMSMMWDSPRAVQKPSNVCLLHKGLWHAAEVAVVWGKLALVTEEKQGGVQRKFKHMWDFSVHLQSFVSLSYEKVMCKYIWPNLTENICATLWYENQMQSKSFGHSPGWADKNLGQMPLALPAFSWICMFPHASPSFYPCFPTVQVVSLGFCFSLRPPLRRETVTESQSSRAAWNPSRKDSVGLTPCFPQFIRELMAILDVVVSSWLRHSLSLPKVTFTFSFSCFSPIKWTYEQNDCHLAWAPLLISAGHQC